MCSVSNFVAQLQASRGRWQEAAATYKLLLSMYTSLPPSVAQRVHLAHGRALLALSRNDEAAAEVAAAIGIGLRGRGGAEAHFWMGIIEGRIGNFGGARAAYEAALFLDHTYAPALHNLGSIAFIQNHLDEGHHFYNASLRGHEAPADLCVDADCVVLAVESVVAHILDVFSASTRGSPADEAPILLSLQKFVSARERIDLDRFHVRLGKRLQNEGAEAEAHAHLLTAVARNASLGWLLFHVDASVPLVLDSSRQAAAVLGRVRSNVARLLAEVQEACPADDGSTALPLSPPVPQQPCGHLSRLEDAGELFHQMYSLPFLGLPYTHEAMLIATLWRAAGLASDAVSPALEERYALVASRRPTGEVLAPGTVPVGQGRTTVRVGIISGNWGQDTVLGRMTRGIARTLKEATFKLDNAGGKTGALARRRDCCAVVAAAAAMCGIRLCDADVCGALQTP